MALPCSANDGLPHLDIAADERAGHATISWELDDTSSRTGTFELEQSARADFTEATVTYTGPQSSSVVSGLPNGVRFYRVRHRPAGRESWGEWSQPKELRINHHSRRVAGGLFGLGAVVFLLTAGFITRAARRTEG